MRRVAVMSKPNDLTVLMRLPKLADIKATDF